jgi:hypothetical protein
VVLSPYSSALFHYQWNAEFVCLGNILLSAQQLYDIEYASQHQLFACYSSSFSFPGRARRLFGALLPSLLQARGSGRPWQAGESEVWLLQPFEQVLRTGKLAHPILHHRA